MAILQQWAKNFRPSQQVLQAHEDDVVRACYEIHCLSRGITDLVAPENIPRLRHQAAAFINIAARSICIAIWQNLIFIIIIVCR